LNKHRGGLRQGIEQRLKDQSEKAGFAPAFLLGRETWPREK